ncbi:DUF4139 domain-containing protein [Streptomyces roseicoloratus]|uniref:DUF4139 domain-containing protein n=1 Tax=Streptomyces roseicoloratus TaxID=2508722 RepID=A0ABY9S5E1_9ACTN|nr:DUF4139 domain-containing protein [Streptomyces roseicoloratus]WMX49118.1 DUF4139 domain-containing protein [Streptomyces roseicoloratus]
MGTDQRWESVLDGVVVYAQGALCTRLARGVVPSDGRVRVTGLPRTADAGSLRARVLGASDVRVTEARIETEAEPVGDGDRDALLREVERLRDACATARGRRQRQRALIDEVAALRPVPPQRRRDDPPHRTTPVEAWLELADFVDERLTGLHARLAELDEALRDVEHELSVAEDRFARASTAGTSAHVATTVCAVVTLDGVPAGGGAGDDVVELELEYGVPGAVWVPAYRLSCRQEDGDGRLLLRASVAQRTGEDWTGVRVALATADLRRRTDLPRLGSLRIGRSQPAPAPAGWREPPAGLADLFTAYDARSRQPSRPRAAGGAAAAAGPLPDGTPASPLPPPPPPPMPAPAVAPLPQAAGPAYGAAPGAMGGAPRARRAAPAPAGAPASFLPAAPGAAPPPPPPPGGAVPPPAPPEPVAGPPRPSGDELDYAGLVLCGADERSERRGRLFPGAPSDAVAARHRRLAETVAALPLPRHAVRPRESAGSFDHRFDAGARADIPSDGTWHTVTVGEVAVGLRTEYLTVPSVEQTVYATLVLSNASDRALLAGPVEVVVDDEFLLTTGLPTLAPGAVRRVGLGPAEGIRVTRRTNLHESTAGLRGGTTVLDHRVHVELANTLARPVTVEVRERVPVTSESDVRIEERADWTTPGDGGGTDASGPHGPEGVGGPEGAEQHAAGTRVWRVALPAGGTVVLDGGYEIRIPAGKALVDGNRRS